MLLGMRGLSFIELLKKAKSMALLSIRLKETIIKLPILIGLLKVRLPQGF